MNTALVFSSLILSLLLIVITGNFFKSKNIIDDINKRSSHSTLATRSGGIAVFTSIFLISCVNYLFGNTLFDYSILVPLGLLVCIGLYDDIFNMDFKLKFIFQIIAAKIIIDTGLLIDNFHGVLGIFELNRAFAQIFTIFVIISVINAINFIDGIDGLAISIFSLFIVLVEFFALSSTQYYNFSKLILVTILPLFYLNFRKENKIFLGDSGSHLLGGIVSIYVIYILSDNYIIKPEYDLHKIVFTISVLLYPIVDIIRVTIIRLIKNESPFKADKRHLHHWALRYTDSHLTIVILIIMIQLVLLITFQTLLN